MSFGPACERCGGNSYEPSMIEGPPICPWCHKPKKRGSREEMVSVLNDAKHALYAAVGFIQGQSVSSKEAICKWLAKTVKAIEDV